MKQKRILSVQDISCFGKCSNTVALPILSAADAETVILPTALLSTHTGGFPGFTFLDLTEEMERFVKGETQILVATTVIEVGVNVPNASVMVILDAQRFGLSQLHQLRGRVGRGSDQSYCILVTNYKLSEETRKRIDIMCDTNDGFQIAEADLKLRGPGDLEGTQQSGMAFDLKIANIAKDGQLVQLARTEAQAIIDNDPLCEKPQNSILWNRLRELKKTNINWAAIS